MEQVYDGSLHEQSHGESFEFGENGLARVPSEETDPYRLTRGFLEDPSAFLRHLFDGA